MADDELIHSEVRDFTFDPENLDEDNLRTPTADAVWRAKRSGVRRVRDESGELFAWSVPWQAYLWKLDPELDVMVSPVVAETELVTRKVSRRDGGTFIEVRIPAAFFADVSRDQAQDIYRLVARDTYVWGMERFGWPEPPAIPGGVPAHAARIPVEARGLAAHEAGRRLLMHVEWCSTAPCRAPHLNKRLAADRAWQDYLGVVNPNEDVLFTLHVTDDTSGIGRDAWEDPPDEPGAEPTTTVETRVPAHLLSGSDAAVERACLEIVTETYAWAAGRFGWPAPPG